MGYRLTQHPPPIFKEPYKESFHSGNFLPPRECPHIFHLGGKDASMLGRSVKDISNPGFAEYSDIQIYSNMFSI